MIQELVYTSARKGQKVGSSGFCTVASTGGMAANLANELEGLSGYRHLFNPGDPANPVAFSHLTTKIGGVEYSILSAIRDANKDYSDRSNKLAHHVAIAKREIPDGSPVSLFRTNFFRTSWDEEPKTLEPRAIPFLPDPKTGVCNQWRVFAGDAGWAGAIVEAKQKGQFASIVYQPGTDVLSLIDEALALLPPNERWKVSFSTFFTKISPKYSCDWRFIPAGIPEAQTARRLRGSIFIESNMANPPQQSKYVEAARTGKSVTKSRPAFSAPPTPSDDLLLDSPGPGVPSPQNVQFPELTPSLTEDDLIQPAVAPAQKRPAKPPMITDDRAERQGHDRQEFADDQNSYDDASPLGPRPGEQPANVNWLAVVLGILLMLGLPTAFLMGDLLDPFFEKQSRQMASNDATQSENGGQTEEANSEGGSKEDRSNSKGSKEPLEVTEAEKQRIAKEEAERKKADADAKAEAEKQRKAKEEADAEKQRKAKEEADAEKQRKAKEETDAEKQRKAKEEAEAEKQRKAKEGVEDDPLTANPRKTRTLKLAIPDDQKLNEAKTSWTICTLPEEYKISKINLHQPLGSEDGKINIQFDDKEKHLTLEYKGKGYTVKQAGEELLIESRQPMTNSDLNRIFNKEKDQQLVFASVLEITFNNNQSEYVPILKTVNISEPQKCKTPRTVQQVTDLFRGNRYENIPFFTKDLAFHLQEDQSNKDTEVKSIDFKVGHQSNESKIIGFYTFNKKVFDDGTVKFNQVNNNQALKESEKKKKTDEMTVKYLTQLQAELTHDFSVRPKFENPQCNEKALEIKVTVKAEFK